MSHFEDAATPPALRDDCVEVLQSAASSPEERQEAFSAIYSAYYADLFRFTRSILRSEESAQDITQDVFEKLFRNPHAYRQEGVDFKAWLIRVARNATYDHIRKHGRVSLTDPELIRTTTAIDPETVVLAKERLHTMLGAISVERQHMLVAQAVGYNNTEIAAIHDQPIEAVDRRISRARKAAKIKDAGYAAGLEVNNLNLAA